MRHDRFALAFSLLLLAALPVSAAPTAAVEVQPVALDTEMTINGVEVACTGIGETRADPKWTAYPIRVEVSDAKNQYITDSTVVLADAKGRKLLSVTCGGPWVLMKPARGAYKVFVQLMDSRAKPRSAPFTVPAHGQRRVVLQFPDA